MLKMISIILLRAQFMKQTLPKPLKRLPSVPLDLKIRLVEQALQPVVFVAKLARDNGINDTSLFNWCQRYRQEKFDVNLKSPPHSRLSYRRLHTHHPYVLLYPVRRKAPSFRAKILGAVFRLTWCLLLLNVLPGD